MYGLGFAPARAVSQKTANDSLGRRMGGSQGDWIGRTPWLILGNPTHSCSFAAGVLYPNVLEDSGAGMRDAPSRRQAPDSISVVGTQASHRTSRGGRLTVVISSMAGTFHRYQS